MSESENATQEDRPNLTMAVFESSEPGIGTSTYIPGKTAPNAVIYDDVERFFEAGLSTAFLEIVSERVREAKRPVADTHFVIHNITPLNNPVIKGWIVEAERIDVQMPNYAEVFILHLQDNLEARGFIDLTRRLGHREKSFVEQVAEKLGVPLVDIKLSESDPKDFKGLPIEASDG